MSKDGKSAFYGQLGGGVNMDLSGNVMAGWNQFLTEHIALNLGLGYRYLNAIQTQT